MVNGKKVAFLTLGCKVNSYETEAMQALLVHAGAEVTEFHETADVYIVNTCSVTNMQNQSRSSHLHLHGYGYRFGSFPLPFGFGRHPALCRNAARPGR